MTPDGLNGSCGACLSRGRRVSPLPARPARFMLWAAKQLTGCKREAAAPLSVCWECRATADRILRFCERVHRAQTLLSSIDDSKLIDADKFTTMSTLGLITKIGFDHEFLCLGLDPVEIFSEGEETDGDKFYQDTQNDSTWEPDLCPIASLQDKLQFSNVKVTQPEEGCFIVMNDITKKPYIGDTYHSEHDRVTITKTKCSRVVEMNLSDLKSKKAELISKNIRKVTEATVESDESSPTVKLFPADFVPSQRPGVDIEHEMLAAREEDRRAQPYAGSPFQCDTCIVGFKSAALLVKHNHSTHSPDAGAHRCDICAARSPGARQAASHRRSHFQLYACARCGHTRRRLVDVRRHVEASHEGDRAYVCRACGKLFMKLRQLKYHHETKHRARPECPQCGKTFASADSYSQHLKLHAGLPLYECDHCKKSYRGKAAIKTHMRTHEAGGGGEDAFCAECNTQFKNTFIYRAHLRTSLKHVRPDDLKHRCDACGKGFMLRRDLRLHYDFVHLRAETYKCHTCDKNFMNPRNLKRHKLRAHDGVPPARNKICAVCDKAFINKKDLMQHQDIHTGARPYSCDMCASTFRQSAALYTHRRLVHLKIKRTSKGANNYDNGK